MPDEMGPVRVVVVDDYRPLRLLLRELLEERGCVVVAEAATGREAVEIVDGGCDVVVMDLEMPELDGHSATGQISARHPGVEIIGFTSDDDPAVAEELMAAGASCHFNKLEINALVAYVADRERRSVA